MNKIILSNLNNKNLTPYVHTIELVGNSGAGKTEFSLIFATPNAQEILERCVGEVNSTVKERKLIFIDEDEYEFKDKILVAVSLKEDMLEHTAFSSMVKTAIAETIRIKVTDTKNKKGDVINVFKNEFLSEIAKESGSTAIVFNFLSDKEKEDFAKEVASVLHGSEYDFSKKYEEIYNKVINDRKDKDTSANNNDFLSRLESEVEHFIFSEVNRNLIKDLYDKCDKVNEDLKETFFKYFDRNQRSKDGLYYKVLSTNEEDDEEFIDAMFTANASLKEGAQPLEVLCEQIFIYSPMSEAAKNAIKSNENTTNAFRDEKGKIKFGILDTRGLFHTVTDGRKNGDYLNNLIYQEESDAVVLVDPLQGDSNKNHANNLYAPLINKLKKQIPIFILCNKVDLYIDNLKKRRTKRNAPKMTPEEMFGKVDEEVKKIRFDFENAQNEKRKNLEITTLACYLRIEDDYRPEGAVEKYKPEKALETILTVTADFIGRTACKIPVVLKNTDPEICINESVLSAYISARIGEADALKTVFSPGEQNLQKNFGVIPHGNSYYALKRELMFGRGYNSKIDEEHYVNCNSFSVSFPGNLRNFVSDALIMNVLNAKDGLKFEGCEITDPQDKDKFIKLVKGYLNKNLFVSILLYEYALTEAEKTGFGFGSYFKNFLRNSVPLIQKSGIGGMDEAEYDEYKRDKYKEALTRVFEAAIEKTIAYNVCYK